MNPNAFIRRGLILSRLRAVFPAVLPVNNLLSSGGICYPEGKAEFSREIAYLEKKGLIEVSSYGERRTAAITTRGMDVVDEAIKEPGIEMK